MSERETATARVELGKDLNLKGVFPLHTYAEWKNAAESGLRGAPFEKKLVSKTPEGIDIQPLYLREDLLSLPHLKEFPGLQTRSRGGTASGNLSCGWEIAQETVDPDPQEAGKVLRNALNLGQTAVTFCLSPAFRRGANAEEDNGDGLYLTGTGDLEALIHEVDWSACPLHFCAGSSGLAVAMLLQDLAGRENRDLAKLRGSIQHDPLGEWVRNGTLPLSTEQAGRETATLVRWAASHAPDVQTVCANGLVYHEAGADAVSELGFVLATAVDYLADLTQRGIPVDQAASQFRFAFGVGTHFLMEIAKLRAARILWSRAVEAFGGNHAARRIRVHARTSRYCQSRYDAHVNILRATTATFAAVVGGADSIHTSPFDESFRVPNHLSRRVARNTQIILDAESHFRHLIDPAGGAYAIENLTHELAAKAWDLFREVESLGGMTRAIAAGFPQERVLAVHSQRALKIATRHTVIVGTSHYANINEAPLEIEPLDLSQKRAAGMRFNSRSLQRNKKSLRELLDKAPNLEAEEWISWGVKALGAGAAPFEILSALRHQPGKISPADPLSACRAAEPFENLRDRNESFMRRTGKRPRVFLANLGSPDQYKARAEFSRGFFEAAGFAVESPGDFASPQAAAAAAADSTAPVVVICSSDDRYSEWAPLLIQALRKLTNNALVVLAGYPEESIATLKEAGVDEFIHLRANAIDVLSRIQQRIGVAVS
ncbi:MAG: acyl-CoA mutase large subunit family protein [Candidatus Aminicenantes bacterium]|nr:acyl-CoA mutase large subunit family protein [Candidatus Aminicenantes bacterium]